MTQLLPPVPAT